MQKSKNQKNIYIYLLQVFLLATILALPLSFYYTRISVKNSLTSATTNTKNPERSQPKIPKPTPFVTLSPLPEKYLIDGGTHAFQTFNNCGPASLSMTLSFYDVFVTQKELGNELRPWQNPQGINDDKSVTLPELAKKAEDYGFLTFHRPGGNIDLLKRFVANDIPVLTRTLTKPNEDIGHYRVIYGYDDSINQILQNDSLQGKALTFTYEDFMQLWKPYGYEYLVLVPKDKRNIAQAVLGENIDEYIAWKNAVNNLEIEVNNNSDDIFLIFSLSVAYYNVGNYQKSIEIFEEIEHNLSFRTLWYQIEPLLAYQKLKKYNELLPRIENILTNGNLAFSELYQIRGEVYLEQGKIDQANKEFEKALFYNKNFSADTLK